MTHVFFVLKVHCCTTVNLAHGVQGTVVHSTHGVLQGNIPLHAAAQKGLCTVAKILLLRHADVNATNCQVLFTLPPCLLFLAPAR